MSKFKVGDRVVRKDSEIFSSGKYVATVSRKKNLGGVWLEETDTWVEGYKLTLHGQTLAELDVKPGDVVECVEKGDDIFMYSANEIATISKKGKWFGMSKSSCKGLFRIISRAADEWTLCPDGYTEQDNHECTYHMGVPVAWRVIDVPLVDFSKREYKMWGDMNPEEKVELLSYWVHGGKIQFYSPHSKQWQTAKPSWSNKTKYRKAGDK